MSIYQLTELAMRVAENERRLSGMFLHGTVAEIDIGRKRIRMDLGEATTGGRFVGPWVPYSQWAGALAVHTPPTVGQQFTMLCPTGDLQQAVAIPLTWSDNFASPSDLLPENIITYGNVTIELRDEQTKVGVGDEATVDVTTDTITVSHTDSSVEMTADQIEAKQGGSTVTMVENQITAETGGSTVDMTDGKVEVANGGSKAEITSGSARLENGASSVDVSAGIIKVMAPVVIIS